MGHTQEEKAASRERIVAATARRIREQGLERPAIAEIMREAGLTHGGFYKHFASRDELIAEAIGHATSDVAEGLEASVLASPDPIAAIADAYLSTAHRDHPENGCALPALGEEVRHATPAARAAYAAQVDRYLEVLQAVDDRGDEDGTDRTAAAGANSTAAAGAEPAAAASAAAASADGADPAADRAVVTLSAMVGALVLSRALGTTPQSDALLASVQAAVRDRQILPGSPPATAPTAEQDPA